MKSFMIPEYAHEKWAHVETNLGTETMPFDVAGDTNPGSWEDHCEGAPLEVETSVGWGWRLSAPGYMDCTCWAAPYKTEAEAVKACGDWHQDICPLCGEETDEDYQLTCNCELPS